MSDALIVQVTLTATLALFLFSKLRYDIVALLALFTLVLSGIVPAEDAFSGFGNPAVVTVVAVLVISRAMEKAGLGAWAYRIVADVGHNRILLIGSLCLLVALTSAFINNIGALALMLPVAMETCRKARISPSLVLMPMAFASLLGGMTTLIGTPSNLIVSDFRRHVVGEPFTMFDYSPVGIGVMMAGITYLAFVGWRLLPKRTANQEGDLFQIDDYFTEVIVPPASAIEGQTINDVLDESDDLLVITIRRKNEIFTAGLKSFVLRAGDVMILRADSKTIARFLTASGTKLTGDKIDEHDFDSAEMEAVEAVVMAGATIEGSTAHRLNLRRLFSINLLALARKGRMIATRLKNERIRAGDVLLMQIPRASIRSTLSRLGMLPLAKRDLDLPRIPRLLTAMLTFGIAISLTTVGVLPSYVAFSLAATALVLLSVLTVRDAYEAIDWPIVVLLGAMIPVGTAFETSGAAADLARYLVSIDTLHNPVLMLVVLMVSTMLLTDVLNNAASAIVMCPVAIHLARALEVNPDAYLIATAISASCSFLTPIGHQSNTLVMGIGGYEFTDYFRLGLLMTIIIPAVSIPLILQVWPL